MSITASENLDIHQGSPTTPGAELRQDLALDRCYGDFLVVSGIAPEAHGWLPDVPADLETRVFTAPQLHFVLRGTKDFFERRVAIMADQQVVVVLGTCFDRDSGRRVGPQDFLSGPLDARLGDRLWGQFCILRLQLDSGHVEWLNDLQSSFSPWIQTRNAARIAMRFAPLPSRTGAALDPTGAGEFLVHGIVGGTRTPIVNWRRQPAASVISWLDGLEARRTRYAHPFHEPQHPAGDPYVVFADRLQEVMEQALVDYESALLPVTGGIDSRMLLAALLASQSKLECYTHGSPGCADDLVTQEYKKKLHIPQRFHAITEDQYALFKSRVIGNLTRLGPDYDSLAYPHVLTSYEREQPTNRLFTAGVGTGIHKIPYMPKTAHSLSPVPIVDAIVGHYGRSSQTRLLRADVAENAVQQMRRSIQECIAECPTGIKRVQRVQYYHMQQRLGRWANRGMQLQDLCGYDIIYPFMDPQLMRQSHRLGFAAQHMGQKIIRAIRHLQPQLLDINNANGWPCSVLTPSAILQHGPAYWRGLQNYLHRRRSGQVAKNIAIVNYRNVLANAYKEWSVELLDPQSSHLAGVVREQAMQQLHEQLQAGSANPKVVGPIAALELWCRS